MERGSDAATLHAGGRTVAAVYLLGFVAESYAKALCAAKGKPPPRGRDGHDIVVILGQAGFRRVDLPEWVRRFAEVRDVSLRYQTRLPVGTDPDTEIKDAQRLIAWCRTRLNRPTRRRTR